MKRSASAVTLDTTSSNCIMMSAPRGRKREEGGVEEGELRRVSRGGWIRGEGSRGQEKKYRSLGLKDED